MCSVKKMVFLDLSQNSQKNTCARVSFLITLQRLWHRFFLVNFSKFLRVPLLQNTSGRVLLYFSFSIDYHELSVTSFPHSLKIWWMFRKQSSKASLDRLNSKAAVRKCSTESVVEVWNFVKKRLWYRCFPTNFAKLLNHDVWNSKLKKIHEQQPFLSFFQGLRNGFWRIAYMNSEYIRWNISTREGCLIEFASHFSCNSEVEWGKGISRYLIYRWQATSSCRVSHYKTKYK